MCFGASMTDLAPSQIKQKIETSSSKSSDQIRQAWKMMGRHQCIERGLWHKIITSKLGINCTHGVSNYLFKKYDADGSGTLDLYEVLRALMPQDFTEPLWNVENEDKQNKLRRSNSFPVMQGEYKDALRKGGLKMEMGNRGGAPKRIIGQLQDKVSSHASRTTDVTRQAWQKMFRRQPYVSPALLCDVCVENGIACTEGQAAEVLALVAGWSGAQPDPNGLGIKFHNFASALLGFHIDPQHVTTEVERPDAWRCPKCGLDGLDTRKCPICGDRKPAQPVASDFMQGTHNSLSGGGKPGRHRTFPEARIAHPRSQSTMLPPLLDPMLMPGGKLPNVPPQPQGPLTWRTSINKHDIGALKACFPRAGSSAPPPQALHLAASTGQLGSCMLPAC